MITKYNYLLLGLLLAACYSCGDFLEEVSQDEFEPETAVAFQELLNGQGYCFSELDGLTWYMSDDVDGCECNYSSDVYSAYRDVFTWQYYMHQTLEDNNIQDYTYENYYECIMVCNVITDYIEESEGSEEEINTTLGEALALRAYYYFQLVNIFATPYNDSRSTPDQRLGVPLVTKSEIRDEGVARNTVEEVYEQITSDIE